MESCGRRCSCIIIQAEARSFLAAEVGDVNRFEAEGATIALRAISSMRRGAVRESNGGWRQELTPEDLGGVFHRTADLLSALESGGPRRPPQCCESRCRGARGRAIACFA